MMDPDESDLIDKLISPTGSFGTGAQQKVIVQRNSPILFPGGTPLTINATSSLLVPNSVPLTVTPQQLTFATAPTGVDAGGTLTMTSSGGGGAGVDSTSVIVLNKDTPLPPGAFPINVVAADPQQHHHQAQFVHGGTMQKVIVAAANPGTSGTASGHAGVQILSTGTMKTFQQKVSLSERFFVYSCESS